MAKQLFFFPSVKPNERPINNANSFKARPLKHHRLSYNLSGNFNKIRLQQQFNRPGSFVTSGGDNNYCYLHHYSSPMLGLTNKVGKFNTSNTCEVGEVITCDPPTNALRRIRNSTIINKEIKSKKQSCKCDPVNKLFNRFSF